MVEVRLVFFILSVLLGGLLIVGSSGNFHGYTSTKEVSVDVVPHENDYIGMSCPDGYSSTVTLSPNSTADFAAVEVVNHLPENEDVSLSLQPDYSAFPEGLEVEFQTDAGPLTLSPGQSGVIGGRVRAGNVSPGVYLLSVGMYALWEGGSASLSPCPIRVVVAGSPTIRKTLVSGNATVPMGVRTEWVFRITVSNPTNEPLDLVVTDTIPSEFRVNPAMTAPSSGFYFLWRGCHCSRGTKLVWYVRVPAGGSETMDVSVYTAGTGCRRGLRTCGVHTLNEGARIEGYDIVSNGLAVEATCSG